MEAATAQDTPPVMDVEEFRSLGLLQEINRLILHPLGLAMYVDPANQRIGVYDDRTDPEGFAFGGDLPYPEKASSVVELLEQRGPARIEALGYVVQPLPPEVKQLKVTVLEPNVQYIGSPDEIDAGEELELTMEEPICGD